MVEPAKATPISIATEKMAAVLLREAMAGAAIVIQAIYEGALTAATRFLHTLSVRSRERGNPGLCHKRN
jgi:hypothetical protein